MEIAVLKDQTQKISFEIETIFFWDFKIEGNFGGKREAEGTNRLDQETPDMRVAITTRFFVLATAHS